MKKAERTKQFIIERSAPVFNIQGLAGTSMSDIMEVTKMAKGGLYGNFENKEELSGAVVEYNLSMLVSKISEEVNQVKGAKNKLCAFIDVFARPMQFPIEGGCPMLNFGTEADDTNPVVKNMVRETILNAQGKVISIINEGITNGEFIAAFDAREFAIKMMAMIEGGVLISKVVGTNDQMEVLVHILKKEIEGCVS